ncbi:ATP-binding cassette domain-containing protein, partial [Xanthomonas citri pv. citri]|nr:ATP-binding cassette domain-containing protein [Xanthomonas citri pv. citri]
MSLLTVHDVHRSYRGPAGDVPVLRGVSLQVPEGGVHAIMGPSGSGKSTLLRGLLGRQAPDEGMAALGSSV